MTPSKERPFSLDPGRANKRYVRPTTPPPRAAPLPMLVPPSCVGRLLLLQARRLLCRHLQIEPPCRESMLGAMATLPLPENLQSQSKEGKIDADQMRLYDEFGIEVPFVRFGKPERRWFRISAQIYNSLPQYEYLAEMLRSLI